MQRKQTQQETMCTQHIWHKYIDDDPSKPTTTNMKQKGTDKYANA